MHSVFSFADKSLDLSRTQVMGVLNVTPDSFSDGGKFSLLDNAVAQAQRMVEQGASIIDIGGESTRPGAAEVSVGEEMDRVLPVIERLKQSVDVILSVDTSTPELMQEAIKLGVHMINDVRAFSKEGAVETIVNSDVALCVMHMKGTPVTMQQNPDYESVVDDVKQYLMDVVASLVEQGVEKSRLIIDPGFGFGKTLEHNLMLLRATDRFVKTGCPLLVGMSRKTMIGQVLDKPIDERLIGSVAAATIAANEGAHIVRVHDVAETVDAIKVVNALKLLGKN